jgi:hypothetical protein
VQVRAKALRELEDLHPRDQEFASPRSGAQAAESHAEQVQPDVATRIPQSSLDLHRVPGEHHVDAVLELHPMVQRGAVREPGEASAIPWALDLARLKSPCGMDDAGRPARGPVPMAPGEGEHADGRARAHDELQR